LTKKSHLISINGKKKFKRILVEGEKFRLQKLLYKRATKGLDRFVFFTAESLPCSET